MIMQFDWYKVRYFGPSEVKIAACILHILSLIITLGPIWTPDDQNQADFPVFGDQCMTH